MTDNVFWKGDNQPNTVYTTLFGIKSNLDLTPLRFPSEINLRSTYGIVQSSMLTERNVSTRKYKLWYPFFHGRSSRLRSGTFVNDSDKMLAHSAFAQLVHRCLERSNFYNQFNYMASYYDQYKVRSSEGDPVFLGDIDSNIFGRRITTEGIVQDSRIDLAATIYAQALEHRWLRLPPPPYFVNSIPNEFRVIASNRDYPANKQKATGKLVSDLQAFFLAVEKDPEFYGSHTSYLHSFFHYLGKNNADLTLIKIMDYLEGDADDIGVSNLLSGSFDNRRSFPRISEYLQMIIFMEGLSRIGQPRLMKAHVLNELTSNYIKWINKKIQVKKTEMAEAEARRIEAKTRLLDTQAELNAFKKELEEQKRLTAQLQAERKRVYLTQVSQLTRQTFSDLSKNIQRKTSFDVDSLIEGGSSMGQGAAASGEVVSAAKEGKISKPLLIGGAVVAVSAGVYFYKKSK